MQSGLDFRIDTVINGATLLTLLGGYARFRITESRVSDMWRDFMSRKEQERKK